jgi:hypothetical protein
VPPGTLLFWAATLLGSLNATHLECPPYRAVFDLGAIGHILLGSITLGLILLIMGYRAAKTI